MIERKSKEDRVWTRFREEKKFNLVMVFLSYIFNLDTIQKSRDLTLKDRNN